MICTSPLTLKKVGTSGFEDIFDRFFNDSFLWQGNTQEIPINLTSDDDAVYLTAELAGVDKKDITIDYKSGVLTIAAEKNISTGTEASHYQELRQGKIERPIRVGTVNFDKASASHTNGVLSIVLPKSEENKAKKLKIS